LQDMIDRMNANRIETKNGAYRTDGLTPAYLGGGTALASCAGLSGAARDQCEWGNLLNGAAEVANGGTCDTSSAAQCIGAMLGARGCVTYDSSAELKNSSGLVIPGTGIFTVTVAWQGVSRGATALATNTCGQNLYPDEQTRRIVSATLRIGALKAI